MNLFPLCGLGAVGLIGTTHLASIGVRSITDYALAIAQKEKEVPQDS